MIGFYEDFVIGAENRLGSHEFTREAIIAFATAYDPQPFHVDDAAGAVSIYGSLCASGWHTACICMRTLIDWRDARRKEAEARGEPVPALGVSPGIRDLRWPNPVRAGDTLRARSEALRKRLSRKDPKRGIVEYRYTLLNQHEETAFTCCSINLVALRP